MPEKTLRELDGRILSLADRQTRNDLLYFICPVCPNGHGIMVTWVPPSIHIGGAIWSKAGETVDDITITPSINCDVGPDSSCKFHGWVTNGVVRW